jgi:GDP-mannose 6-dehydrogenase
VHPEFLREGSAVRDFFDPPKTVIGQVDDASGDAVEALYEGLPGPLYRVPILDSILPSNEGQIDRVFKAIEATGKRRVGLFGLSFKAGTDDLRESPMVALAERLLGRGFELMIYDENVAVSRLLGANRAYVDSRIPHLSKLMASSADAVVNHAEVCVIGAADPKAVEALGRVDGKVIVDLVRFPGSEAYEGSPHYIGVGW